MNLPSWVRDLQDQSAPDFVHQIYRRAKGRAPDEYETSYYLHRLLIGRVAKEDIARELLGSESEERFVSAVYRERTGREPSPDELAQGIRTVRSGLLGDVVFRRQLGVPVPELEDVFPAQPALAQVMNLDGEAFVRAAYRLSGKDASASEIAAALLRLKSGTLSKVGLLSEISAPGAETLRSRNRWFRIPVLGRFLQVAALVWNLPNLEQDIAALRHRHADLEIRLRLLGMNTHGRD